MKVLLYFCLGLIPLNLMAGDIDTDKLVKKIESNLNNQQILSEVYYDDLNGVEEEITTGAGSNYIGIKTIQNITCTMTVNMNDDGVIENYNCSTK